MCLCVCVGWVYGKGIITTRVNSQKSENNKRLQQWFSNFSRLAPLWLPGGFLIAPTPLKYTCEYLPLFAMLQTENRLHLNMYFTCKHNFANQLFSLYFFPLSFNWF